MTTVFIISLEQPALSKSEILATLRLINIEPKHFSDGRLFFVDCKLSLENLDFIARRIALSFYICELISKPSTIEQLYQELESLEFSDDEIVSLHIHNKWGVQNPECSVPNFKLLREKIHCKNFSYKNSNRIIDIYFTENSIYVLNRIRTIPRAEFVKRANRYRPFQSPISIEPKYARAMINLSEAKAGERFGDPFCGTGGILIEAALVGLYPIGGDISSKVVSGAKKNLEFFGIHNYIFYVGDVSEIKNYSPLVICTDLPYGRSTTTKKEPLKELYTRAFRIFHDTLSYGQKAVIIIPDIKYLELCRNLFSIVEVHELRVHRSLTRYFVVMSSE